MLLFWRIRYLDSRDKTFKDRDLTLITENLDSVNRVAVELCLALRDRGPGRELLRFRHLFQESQLNAAEIGEQTRILGHCHATCLPDYLEDEEARELSGNQMAAILTGSPNAVIWPSWARRHDIELAFANNPHIDISEITLIQKEIRTLFLFSRDVRELMASTFLCSGPGTIRSVGHGDATLQTTASDEEIRSFVTIFRRLYMEGDPANFLVASEVFARAVGDHPLGKWIAGGAQEYREGLEKNAKSTPSFIIGKLPFDRKRIIDVFLYTQFAHQPAERREKQFRECLEAVGGKRPILFWVFLSELFECGLQIRHTGGVIASIFDAYRQHHCLSDETLASLQTDNPGIGTLESESKRRERLFKEAVQRLAEELWQQQDCPQGGPAQFESEAHSRLKDTLGG